MPNPGTLQKGVRVGRYLLQTRLATGGMADVWLATATGVSGFQKTVVLKTILPHLAENPEFVRMFINEALLAAVLDHPNIVHIFDLGQFDEAYFIAMEYIAGRTLRQVQKELRRSKKRVTPPWFALYVAAQVCDALDYAHAKRDEAGRHLGLVHRDITPENIMVSFTGETKVLDFGIAKANSAAMSTQVGTLKGKFAYMAPEQIAGAAERSAADPKYDIYALGVVLYEMFTGKRPYRANNEILLLKRILDDEAARPSTIASWIPHPLESLIMRAMARDPEERFQSAAEMRAAIEEFLTSRNLHPTKRHIAEYMAGLFGNDGDKAMSSETHAIGSGGGYKPGTMPSAGVSTSASEVRSADAPLSVEISVELPVDSTELGPGSERAVEVADGAEDAARADDGITWHRRVGAGAAEPAKGKPAAAVGAAKGPAVAPGAVSAPAGGAAKGPAVAPGAASAAAAGATSPPTAIVAPAAGGSPAGLGKSPPAAKGAGAIPPVPLPPLPSFGRAGPGIPPPPPPPPIPAAAPKAVAKPVATGARQGAATLSESERDKAALRPLGRGSPPANPLGGGASGKAPAGGSGQGTSSAQTAAASGAAQAPVPAAASPAPSLGSAKAPGATPLSPGVTPLAPGASLIPKPATSGAVPLPKVAIATSATRGMLPSTTGAASPPAGAPSPPVPADATPSAGSAPSEKAAPAASKSDSSGSPSGDRAAPAGALPRPATSGLRPSTAVSVAAPVALPKPATSGLRPSTDGSVSAPVAVIPKASTSGQVSAPQSALARPQTTGTPGASGSGGSTAASEADGRAGDDAARASSSTPTPSAPSVADRASDPGADDTDEVTTGGTRRSHAWDLVMERARRARHDEVVRTSGGTPVSGAESPRESEDAGPTAAVGSASEPVDDDDGRASVNPWDLVVQQARREARAEAERASERADERADERSSDAGSTTAKDIWSRSSRRAREERSPGGNPWARRELVSDETRALRLFDQGMDCMRSRDYEGARAAWREALEVDPNNRMIQGNLRTLEKLMSDGGNDD